MSKVTNIKDKKSKKKPMTPKQIAERAVQEHLKKVDVKDEPRGLASGKAAPDGGFVHEDDDESEEEGKS